MKARSQILPILLLASPAAAYAASLLTLNAPALVASADLTYDRPPSRSEAGLPVGNGRMGSLVWTEPAAVKLQINRVDVFGNNSATRSFPERNTDYCGGCARLDVVFAGGGPEVFPVVGTTEHLSCYEGRAAIQGHGVTVEALAWADQDVIALQIEDRRENPGEIHLDLRTLRPALVKTRFQSATSSLESRGAQLRLTQHFQEESFYCGSAVTVGVNGRQTRSEAVNDQLLRLVISPGRGRFTVFISSAAGFDPQADLGAAADRALAAARLQEFAGLAKANVAWWGDFWARSFIHLHSADGIADQVERNYTYYLYIMGSTSRGRYPTKFNGMLWSTGGDTRSWGGQFWGANQSCYYNNALFAANQIELMDPMFDMYTGMIDSCARGAREEWGSTGVYLPETVAFDGLGPLPDEIAAEMRDLYLLKKPWADRSQRFLDYGASMMGYSSRWNWISKGKWVGDKWVYTERGGGPYGPTSHIFSRGAKIAYQYWLRYDYTGDLAWLRDRAYPMLKGVAEFYRNFPNVSKGADGRYHIHNVNSNEPLWGAQDTDEEISSMRGLLPVAIEAAEILKVDAGLRPIWREFLDHLAPFAEGGPPDAPIWVKGLPPAVHGNPAGLPDGNTMPMWFFDLCTLESDPAMMKTANATFDAFFPRGFAEARRAGILSKLPLTAAILGRTDAVRHLLPAQVAAASPTVLANRMDLREGGQTTGIERLGNAADALHTALCGDLPAGPGRPPILRVFPAWPSEWDAAFSLRGRDGFMVTASQRGGQIEFVEIQSLLGRECRLRNPWGAGPATVYRDGEKAETLDGGLLVFDLHQGKAIVLVRAGTDPDAFKRAVPAEPSAASLPPHGNL